MDPNATPPIPPPRSLRAARLDWRSTRLALCVGAMALGTLGFWKTGWNEHLFGEWLLFNEALVATYVTGRVLQRRGQA